MCWSCCAVPGGCDAIGAERCEDSWSARSRSGSRASNMLFRLARRQTRNSAPSVPSPLAMDCVDFVLLV